MFRRSPISTRFPCPTLFRSVGSNRTIVDMERQIARVAATNATVLIRGESGVGKELVARALHFSSPRREGPFVCLKCADRKSTRLNSSHQIISYAVFCLKKKN